MKKAITPWAYIPTLYFGEGLPYAIIITLSLVMYQRMGVSEAEAVLYTSWFYLPWVIKPLWSPFIDLIRTKRFWIIASQFTMGVAFAGIAFLLPTDFFIQSTLALFWLLAFSSATHDIAADGFYLHALDSHDQSYFVGIRNTCYRIAMLTGQGLLLILAGFIGCHTHQVAWVWSIVFGFTAVVLLSLALYHRTILPRPTSDGSQQVQSGSELFKGTLTTLQTFATRKHLLSALLFILFYRLPEALLAKTVPLFLIADSSHGGLALTDTQIGMAQGIFGVIGLMLGGIIGGMVVSQKGLKYWLFPMVCAISLPDMVYIYLSYMPHTPFFIINVLVIIEQFGYGFGFTAYTLYMIYFTQGTYRTSHFALCTGLMALGMMLPGFLAGKLIAHYSYQTLFILICCLTVITFWVSSCVKIDADFGKKHQ